VGLGSPSADVLGGAGLGVSGVPGPPSVAAVDASSVVRVSHLCMECGRCFPTRFALKRHVRSVHAGVRGHICGVCGQSFGARQTLLRHGVVHQVSSSTGLECEGCSGCGEWGCI
jgi:uncharacterized Zn-finger protein